MGTRSSRKRSKKYKKKGSPSIDGVDKRTRGRPRKYPREESSINGDDSIPKENSPEISNSSETTAEYVMPEITSYSSIAVKSEPSTDELFDTVLPKVELLQSQLTLLYNSVSDKTPDTTLIFDSIERIVQDLKKSYVREVDERQNEYEMYSVLMAGRCRSHDRLKAAYNTQYTTATLAMLDNHRYKQRFGELED